MINGGIFELDKKLKQIKEKEIEISRPEFWQQPDAQKKIKEYNSFKEKILEWKKLRDFIYDTDEIIKIALEENDESILSEIEGSIDQIEKRYNELLTLLLFQEESDERDAYLTIHSGAGGTEACDWASMLFRMYTRWAEGKGFNWKIIEFQPGDEVGIRSATILIKGKYAYGLLKSEIGIHRLVRISPFDANRRRHTSFASVDVVPAIEDDIEVDIQEKDLKIETYRASGPGGQHVNVTDSAVRITHLPTGIVVQCQNERSQYQNRITAMKLLRARLYEYYKKKMEDEKLAREKAKKKIEWGSQIRSYVFQPYVLVKDHRTGTETGNGNAVMDGEIDIFIQSYLEMNSKI